MFALCRTPAEVYDVHEGAQIEPDTPLNWQPMQLKQTQGKIILHIVVKSKTCNDAAMFEHAVAVRL